MELDLRTEHQKTVAQRAKRVCDLYKKLQGSSVGSETALWRHIAEKIKKEFGAPISPEGVRDILIRNELYVPRQ